LTNGARIQTWTATPFGTRPSSVPSIFQELCKLLTIQS
jgi:hypothetical protein